MALDRLTNITRSGLGSVHSYDVAGLVAVGVVTASSISGNFTGNITGNLVGDVTGNVTGNVTGTATTATNLANAANITTGTISNDRLPATITKNLTGNVTGNVTGNTSGTAGGLTGSPNITVTDITATGNVSIGGTLTYEDVTNIDSVGIITARAGVRIPDDQTVKIGTGGDLSIYHNGSNSHISNTTGGLYIDENIANGDIFLRADNGSGALTNYVFCDGSSGRVVLSHYGTGKIETTSYGAKFSDNVLFENPDTSGRNLTWEADNDSLHWEDNTKATFGGGNDLDMYHDGSDSYIRNSTGQLLIRGNDIKLNNYLGTKTHAEFADGGLTTGAIDLSAISSSITRTATDIFVYDTRKDSDGGAWRKRTQHTSWYNETLNTSTRGSRKEFPAVAVIVAEQNFIRIYDGDDPDLPMWMVFNTIAGGQSQGMADRPMVQLQGVDKVVYALNGILVTGTKNEGSNYGQPVINFISEKVLRMDSQGGEGGEWMGTIAQRNEAIGYRHVDYDYVIAASRVNDVAMTVLPNAPIDDATGLPVPTIAVGTDGGASIIKDDGTVVDITITTGTNYDVEHIDFTDDNRVVILWNAGGGEITIDEIPAADTSANYPINLPGSYYNDHSPGSYFPGFLTEGPSLSNRIPAAIQNFRAVGTTAALSVFEENKESEEDGMVAFISSSYNTGYQQGDIKGAFLSDTDTTNIVASEMVTNGTFDSNTTGWSVLNTGTFTASGGQATLSDSDGTGTSPVAYQAISGFVVGRTYVLSYDTTAAREAYAYISQTAGQNNQNMYILGYTGSRTGTQTVTFVANSTNMIVNFSDGSGSDFNITVDNVSVKLGDKDRSLNNKGLTAYGTITKSAVATGADLVAYSGFSGSNYFKQPYNSSLSAGTGSQTFMGWVYATTDSTLRYLFAIGEQDSNEQFRLGFSNSVVYFDYGSGSAYSQWNSTDAIPDNKWTFVVATITAGQRPRIYIDGKLLTNSPAVNNAAPSTFLTATSYIMTIGINSSLNASNAWNGSLSLIRYSHSVPSLEQIKKIYEDEKHLFQENAKATLYGSSDAVTALGYDEDTELLHVGTSAGRSDFQGLRRINNTTTAVTTAISASDELIAEQ